MPMIAPKQQTLAELRELQRLSARVIMRRLAPGLKMQRRWIDDRDMRIVAGEFIKPNDRLTSFERIEIYNKQYWFRLIDCLYDDYPGLLAVLGEKKFGELVQSYIETYPSRSYALRNLGSQMVQFIRQRPELVAPRFALSLDMARFEWAQIEAFDGKAEPVVKVDDLLGKNPEKLKLGIQPYISLLDLSYPLDDYVLQLKQDGLRGDASNAAEELIEPKKPTPKKRAPLPRPRKVFVAVHRFKNSLYYKRLELDAYLVLKALREGKTVAKALNQKFAKPPTAEQIRDWFETWGTLGWFC